MTNSTHWSIQYQKVSKSMLAQVTDWTNWIITTVMAALASSVATVIGLAKLIDALKSQQIKDLKASIVVLSERHDKCVEEHLRSEKRLAALEALAGESKGNHDK